MYALFIDETNVEPTIEGKFFIFGGLILGINSLQQLDEKIREIRKDAGYKEKDLFKFETHSKPQYVSQEKFNEAKN